MTVIIAKAFLALLSLFLMSFCAIPSLLSKVCEAIYAFKVSPATLRGTSKVVLIHGYQPSIPNRHCLLTELECTSRHPDNWRSQSNLGIPLDRKKSSTIPPLDPSLNIFTTSSMRMRNRREESIYTCLTPVRTSKKSETPFFRITPHSNRT